MNYPGNFIKGSSAFILLLFLYLSVNGFSLQQNQYGIFYVPQLSEWNFVSAQSSGEYFVFQNTKTSETVRIVSSPLTCETKQIFNKYILDIIQSYFKQNQFMEQRKQAVPYPCLGQPYCHMLIIKSRESDKRKFILNPLVDNNMYTIEISGTNNQTEPSPGALHFISQITLEPGNEVLSQNTNPANNPPTNIPLQQTWTTGEDNNLATFKKNKTVSAPTTTETAQTKAEPANTKTEIPKQTPKTNVPVTTNSSVKLPNISAPEVRIEKGNIPQLKISATNPCSGNSNSSGLPWENSQNEKVKMPAGTDVVLPAPIPGLNNLSDQAYNSSVSLAFEGMRLIYGEMTEKEAKEFNEAWAPLFDFPSQEVIDYLNKLNPLVSQFLICREAYARNFAAVQMVL